MNRGQRLARVIDATKRDTDERIDALRLQAKAWRILALVALREPEWATGKAQWLFFKTVPWVDGDAVQEFITENEARARKCGLDAGVFSQGGRDG